MYYFVTWFQLEGWALGPLIDAWYVNAATSGLVWDLTISAVSLTVLAMAASTYWRDYRYLLVVPATYCIGVSCGLPLFAFLLLGANTLPRRKEIA